MNKYPKFFAMIITSTIVMFGLMYLNTYQLDHIYFSETRAYMALVMGATISGRAESATERECARVAA